MTVFLSVVYGVYADSCYSCTFSMCSLSQHLKQSASAEDTAPCCINRLWATTHSDFQSPSGFNEWTMHSSRLWSRLICATIAACMPCTVRLLALSDKCKQTAPKGYYTKHVKVRDGFVWNPGSPASKWDIRQNRVSKLHICQNRGVEKWYLPWTNWGRNETCLENRG